MQYPSRNLEECRRGGSRRGIAVFALAITTALTLRSVFGPALRQTEGLIGSIIALLDFDLAVPDRTILSRRAARLEPPPLRSGDQPHLLVDSTGLRLCGPGEWMVAKLGSQVRRARRKLHLATDSDTGENVAVALTGCHIDDGLHRPQTVAEHPGQHARAAPVRFVARAQTPL